MKIKEKVVEYFRLFGERNLEGLSKIYDDEIHLIDWNGKWVSKTEVLKMNESLFSNNKILINIIEIQNVDKKAYCKIEIQVNDDLLKVMDVIDFNEEGNIIKIEAYNG